VKIQILGAGCPKCRALTEPAEEAARALGLDYEVEKVTDLDAILGFGVMTTPALVVDGTVRLAGKVPDVDTLKGLLT